MDIDNLFEFVIKTTQKIQRRIEGSEIGYFLIIFLIIFLFFPLRISSSFFIIGCLKPQTDDPEWNPMITKLREQVNYLFLTYGDAKKGLLLITWGAIFIYNFVHFRR